jgi:hypothetical protein
MAKRGYIVTVTILIGMLDAPQFDRTRVVVGFVV